MTAAVLRPAASAWRFARSLGAGSAALAVVAVIVAGAAVGPFVTPVSPTDFVGAPFDPPSPDALLGTDLLGRDVLSRLLSGGMRILALSAVATLGGVGLGTMLGAVCGYLKGRADDVLMRCMDVAMAFPQTVLALLFVSIVGAKAWLVALLVAAVHTPQVARVTRSVALRVSEEDFVRYVEALGVPVPRIVAREILPSLAGPVMVELGLRFTYSIALITGLGFLGLMPDPSSPDWGMMINENRIGLLSNPWAVAAPVGVVGILTIATNVLADRFGRGRLLAHEAVADAEPTVASAGWIAPAVAGSPERTQP